MTAPVPPPSPAPTDERFCAELRIAADHPSLPGHFPGRPVVPGVVVLDAVIAAAEAWLGRPLGALALPQVKFVQPLLPAQDARIELDRQEGRLRFRGLRDDALLASGVLEPAA